MRVALVYNQKKEDTSQQSITAEQGEPPSTFNGFASSSISLPADRPSVQHFTDLYAEWDTVDTIDAVRSALAQVHEVSLIEADEHACEKLLALQPEIVFNMSEGLHGSSREAQIPALLEMLQVPYTGSDPLTLGICLDKSRAKEILSYHRISTPAFTIIETPDDSSRAAVRYPSIVKPLHEGSSKGIFNSSIVQNRDELRREVANLISRYQEPALVEEYLEGREFTVALLGNGRRVNVLPIVEIKFDSLPPGVNPIYSYEAKWVWDTADNPLEIFSCPADLSPNLRQEIESLCRRAFTALRCRDWCRIDVRLDAAGTPHVLELNPLPGILPNPEDNSCFPKAARAAGLSYEHLLQSVLTLAAERYGLTSTRSHRTITKEAL